MNIKRLKSLTAFTNFNLLFSSLHELAKMLKDVVLFGHPKHYNMLEYLPIITSYMSSGWFDAPRHGLR